MNIHSIDEGTKKHIIHVFEDLLSNPPSDSGICLGISGSVDADTMHTLFKAWPLYSGEIRFPIPAPTYEELQGYKHRSDHKTYIEKVYGQHWRCDRSPSTLAYTHIDYAYFYDPAHPYGAKRIAFLNWAIEQLNCPEVVEKDTIAQVAKRVSAALSGPNSLGNARRYTSKNRVKWADEMGLTDLGTTEGTCAMVLGIPTEAPNVLVKVVPLTDAFVLWAEGLMADPHRNCPDVYSVTYVGDKAVILQQRIDGAEVSCFEPTPRPPASLQARIETFCTDHGAVDDNHRGNVLVDDDGMFWFIDPVFNTYMGRVSSCSYSTSS